MFIDAQVVTPYLVFILTVALGLAGFYFKSITNKLSDLSASLATLSLKIATLIEHMNNADNDMLDVQKYHDEIIDLKVASATLNERTLTTRSQLAALQIKLKEN